MGIRSLYRKIKDYRSHDKVVLDEHLDHTMFLAGTNAIGLILLDGVQNLVSNNTSEGLATFGTYALWTAGQYALHEFGLLPVADKIKKYNKRKREHHEPATFLSRLKTAGAVLALGAVLFSTPFQGAVRNITYDAKTMAKGAVSSLEREEVKVAREIKELKELDKTPETLQTIIPQEYDRKIAEMIGNTNKTSREGRFCRAFRWDVVYEKMERRYGLPQGILAGLAMHESFGNPLELNLEDEGDAGLFQITPETAKNLGLKVYGNARGYKNRAHGKRLREFVKDRCENDYDCARTPDDRLDVERASDAAARYLRDELKRYGGDMNKALTAFNAGEGTPVNTFYANSVSGFQKYYLERKRSL